MFKIKRIFKEKEFKPVVIEITLDSQDQIDCLFSLFNYAPVCEILVDAGILHGDIRNCLPKSDIYETWFNKIWDIRIKNERNNK